MATGAEKYEELFGEARARFESGQHGECGSVLAELRGLGLKWLQRRKVAALMMDNAFSSDRREDFLDALHSDYVRRNLDRTDYDYWARIAATPPMEVQWPAAPVTLPLYRVGPEGNALYGVDVSVNGVKLSGVLDNCASDYCDISQDLAGKLGVRPIGKRIKINGNRWKRAYIGVVDSLALGDLVLKNVLFSVSGKNEALTAAHPFDVIIGGNVLRQTGDMIIDNEAEKVTFSRETLNLPQNIFWTYPGHGFFVEGSVGEEEVKLLLDLGCSYTNLNKQFLDSLPAETKLPESSTRAVMLDRAWDSKTYTLPSARFAFCDTVCELPNVNILLKDYGTRGMSGKIGTDLFRRYKFVFFNARQLYLRLISE